MAPFVDITLTEDTFPKSISDIQATTKCEQFKPPYAQNTLQLFRLNSVQISKYS